MDQERNRGTSKTQKIGSGILLATIVITMTVGVYMMRNNKRN